MVKFKIKMNAYGQFYMPKEVREELGRRLELLGDAKTALLFPEGLSPTDVLRSLRVLVADLKHRAELESVRDPKPSRRSIS